MNKDAAITQARTERDRTGYPQIVGMRSDGSWYCHALTGRKLTDLEDSAKAWLDYAQADAVQEGR